MGRNNDLIAMWKFPHARYEEQLAMLLEELGKPIAWNGETVTLFDRINTVRGDSNGIGDFPMEYLRDQFGLPMWTRARSRPPR